MATLNEIFSKLNVNVEINSTREIYKKNLFTGLNENDLKKARRKIRKIAFAFANDVVLSKTEKSIILSIIITSFLIISYTPHFKANRGKKTYLKRI